MQVPPPGRFLAACRRGIPAVLAGLAFLPQAASARPKQPPPEVRLSLEDLGFPGVASSVLNSGSSILTLNFVDNDHLLLTYATRGLVKRVAGEPASGDDRMVAAKLLDLPSGRVIATDEWHLRDHGRYLWSLGEGRFLLRSGNTLSTFAPVANLASGRPFERVSLSHRFGTIESILVSGDNKLLTVETSQPDPHQAPPVDPKLAAAKAAEAARPHFAGSANAPPPPPVPTPDPVVPVTKPVILDFYRISGAGTPQSPLLAADAGAVRSPAPLGLPLDSDGYLHSSGTQSGQWTVVFHAFQGKDIPLAPMDSSCPPTVKRIAPGQVVAITCRGITGRVALAAYDFNKHEVWEETMDSSPIPAAFALAPAAGRFAISRYHSNTLSADTALAAPLAVPDDSATQDVRVYQTQTGDLLLKLDCTPAFRAAENFDLSRDGMRVAVVRNGFIEVYRLPELTKLDRDDLAELAKVAPPPATGKIDLKEIAVATSNAAAAAETHTIVSGDSQTPRPRPTLLNPGEKPEFQDKTAQD